MDVAFSTDDLRRLATVRNQTGGFPPEVIKAYRKRVQAIRAAIDERDLYALKSHRFKKLQGDRSHQRAMRLNDQWRLILEIHEANPKNRVIIVAIEDYH